MLGGSQKAENAFCVTPIEKKHGLLVDETAESAVLALKSRKNTIFDQNLDIGPPWGRYSVRAKIHVKKHLRNFFSLIFLSSWVD